MTSLRLRKVYVEVVSRKLQAITKPVEDGLSKHGRIDKTNEELIQSLKGR